MERAVGTLLGEFIWSLIGREGCTQVRQSDPLAASTEASFKPQLMAKAFGANAASKGAESCSVKTHQLDPADGTEWRIIAILPYP